MCRAFIKVFALLATLALTACAGGPNQPGESGAAKVQVDAQAQAEYGQALQALLDSREGDAERLLTDLTQKYPNLAGPFINLGILYIKQDKLDKAKQALLQATTAKPDDALAYNQLGVVYRKLGDFKQAQQAYEQALKLKPDYADAHLNLGILYDVYLGDLAKALVHYEKYQSLSLNPDKLVAKWIIDLKRRVKRQQSRASS